jgi:PAS domain
MERAAPPSPDRAVSLRPRQDHGAPETNGAVVDWDRAAQWTQHIVDGEFRPIAIVFESHGVTPPEIAWNPEADRLAAPPLRFLAAHWQSLAHAPGLPHLRQISPFDMRPALGHIMLLDAIDGGRDFRYRLYGTILAKISRLDMTGRLLSEHPASSYVVELALALYRAALHRRQPIYSARAPAGALETAAWQRVVLPLIDNDGTAVRLLVGTVAVGSDGRMLRA